MAAAPDWSQLPAELLHLISERLDDSPLYRLRFRSVCSTWRSSISHFIPIHQFPFNFPPIPAAAAASTFSLSARSIFLIKPPPDQPTQTPWLVKIGRDSLGRNRIWHPLYRDHSLLGKKQVRRRPPGVLDLTNLFVSHLGNEFVIDHPSSSSRKYKGKVVAAAKAAPLQGSMMLTIRDCGELAAFGFGDDERWTIMLDISTGRAKQYDDVCAFYGGLYAVESGGRAVIVGPDSVLEEEEELFAEENSWAVCCYDEKLKFFVESGGELLMVEKYPNPNYCEYLAEADEDSDDEDSYARKAYKAMFRVFKLGIDAEYESWLVRVEMKSLGGRVLFIGDDCAFSASTSDLGFDEGNCVVFRDDDLIYEIGVCSLDGDYYDQISCLRDYPSFSRLFRSPPDWAMLH